MQGLTNVWTTVRNPQVGDHLYTYPDLERELGYTDYTIDRILDTKELGAHVNYNRRPYDGQGFVFDAADIRSGSGTYLKCLHEDEKRTTLTPTNLFTIPSKYIYSTYKALTWTSDRQVSVKIVNAKAIDPSFDDEIDLVIPFEHDYSFQGDYSTDYQGYHITFTDIYWTPYDDGGYYDGKPGGPGFTLTYYKNNV